MFKSLKFKQWISFFLTVLLLISTLSNGFAVKAYAASADKTFDLVEITDFHGALEDTSSKPVAAVLANRVKAVKAANPNTVIFGGGDLFQGTPISNTLKGVPVQQAMSNIGMEFSEVGNHEFDWGLNTIINTTMKGASFNFICANLYNKNPDGSNGSRVFDPYKIITKDGVRIAFVGAITNDTPNIVMPGYVADKNFTDAATEINSVAKNLKDNNQADVIIAVVHEGEGTLDTIVNKLTNVSAVFGGHTHTVEQKIVNGIPVINASSSGKGYADLKMTVSPDMKVSFPSVTSSYVALNNANGYTSTNPIVDPQVQKIVSDAKAEVGPIFDEVIGNISTDLTRSQDQQPYGESQLGNWASDVVKNYAKADVGVANNGGLRVDFSKGNITVGQIFTFMPFDNEINTVTMNKAQLKTVLEQAVGTYPDPKNPVNTIGGKGIQISGIKFTYDSSKTYGNKVTSITREDGKAISDTEVLKVAGPDFVLTGGDGFLGFTDPVVSATLFNTHKLARDAFLDDIRLNKTIKFVMNNRITPQTQSGSATSMNIADARKLTSGNVTVTGTVTTVNGNNVFIQDSTAGICVYNSSTKADVKKGDKIQVTGPISVYNNLLEITPKSASDVSTISTGNTVTPKVVNISDVNESLEGQLIQINNASLQSYDTSSDSMIQDSTGSISIYKSPELSGINVGDKINVVAAVSQYGSKYELTVGQASDITKVSTGGNSGNEGGSTISVLATSDIHGNVLNYDYAAGKAPSTPQGLAKVSTYVNSVRASNPNVMLIDNGDTIQGTPLSYYYDMLDTTAEYPLMKVMGAMKYDTWTLGNHEFNYGLNTLNRIISDAVNENIKPLSANTYKSDNTNYVQPYYIKSFNVNGKTIKVGILGLTTKTIPNWEDPAHYAGLHFNDLVDEAKLWVPKVRQAGADVVIVSAHSGEEGAADVIPENEVKAIATQVSGIDAIVAGHTHATLNDTSLKNPDGKVVPVVEPSKWGTYVSQIDLNIDKDGKFTGLTTKNVKMDNTIAEDPAIVQLIQPYQNQTLSYIQTKLGTSTGEFKGDGQTTQATPIMGLINKVQKEAAGTQLSIAAPLSSAAYIPKGDITIKDIMSVYVYENFLFGVKMNGKQLKNWMEYSVRYYKQAANSSDPIVKDPTLNIPDYNLDQLYGATYDVDLTQPACTVDPTTGVVTSGNRIKDLKINGVLVKDTDVFTVAINNYRYNGGGGFMRAAGLSSTDPSIVTYDSAKALGDDGQVRSLMMSYIKDHKTISPDSSNNWKVYTTAVSQDVDQTPTTIDNKDGAAVISAVNDAITNNTEIPTIDIKTSPVVSKDVFNAIRGKDKTISFIGNNVTWAFNGKDITSNVTSDIDLSLKTVPTALTSKEIAKVKAVTGKDASIVSFSFNYEGQLPGKAAVKIFIGKNWANKVVSICRYYADKDSYDIVQSNIKVDSDGYITYTTDHCSDYFVTDAASLIPAEAPEQQQPTQQQPTSGQTVQQQPAPVSTAAVTPAAASSTSTTLPKTGQVVDFGALVGMGSLCIILGAMLFVIDKRKKRTDNAA
ncbi:MAG: 5'-nucleotidase C-terminal domain-containing protein [Clostridium sp.]|uniref:5'-nucleotidase C-terminal domain-containing protein n=1 Tax=Clostridium sp. TaxID=1506 RepID=UPI0039EC8C83